MVQSNAATVDDWLASVEPARAEAIRMLRQLCRDRLPGWSERMQWGMPGYGPDGADAAVSFNNQKQYIAFYPGPTTLARFTDRLAGIDCGKGCVRYRRPDRMDFTVIAAMLDDIHARRTA